MKSIKRILITYVLLMIGFVAAMTLTFSPSNNRIDTHIKAADVVWQLEGRYPRLNSKDVGSQLDSYTDSLMVAKTHRGSTDPLYAGMDVTDYARYWHGYLVWLRPMFKFLSYSAVRQVYAIVLICLLFINVYLMAKRLDLLAVIAFGIALMFQRLFAIFISMQYGNVTMVMLVANIFVLALNDRQFIRWRPALFFFVVGAFTNFIDLLTFPLITFGVPLLLALYRQVTLKRTTKFRPVAAFSLAAGISWLTGYAATWLSKWAIASLILKRNVIKEALNEILFRTQGVGRGAPYPINRTAMMKSNISFEFTSVNLLFFGLVSLLCLAVIAVLLIRRHVYCPWPFAVIAFFVAALPYLWYEALSNHSQIHFWFTYREQLLTVLAVFLTLTLTIHTSLNNKDASLTDVLDEIRVSTQ